MANIADDVKTALAAIAALDAKVSAITAPTVTVDNSAVLAAIEDEKTAVLAAVAGVAAELVPTPAPAPAA